MTQEPITRVQTDDCNGPPTFCLPDVVVMGGIGGLLLVALGSYHPAVFLLGLALTYVAAGIAMFVLPRYW